jgi:solute carrier family 25 carnitine/acylcarnitine transporter 20/29
MATMQTKSALYSSEWECLADVVRQDGWLGLFTRGLGATMVREVPIECIYFGLYGYLMSTTLADTLGPFAPFVFGAMSGCASWIPVFPIDTVRTLVQTQYDGESSESGWDIAQKVYRDRGIGAFFDGISPRLMRAALANAVTFYFYDLITSAAAV